MLNKIVSSLLCSVDFAVCVYVYMQEVSKHSSFFFFFFAVTLSRLYLFFLNKSAICHLPTDWQCRTHSDFCSCLIPSFMLHLFYLISLGYEQLIFLHHLSMWDPEVLILTRVPLMMRFLPCLSYSQIVFTIFQIFTP